jgi:hypothetical protein
VIAIAAVSLGLDSGETMGLPAKKKVTESAEALGAAIAAHRRYTEAEIRAALEELRNFAQTDPRIAFGHTVREHRKALEAVDGVLRDMNIYGRVMEHEAALDGLGSAFCTSLREACSKLRVVRTLAATLSGDRGAMEREESSIREAVQALLEERGRAMAGQWDEEEREGLTSQTPKRSAEFEAWLDAP